MEHDSSPTPVGTRLGAGLGLLLALVSSTVALASDATPEAAQVDPAVAGLAAEEYGERFNAALSLLATKRPDLAEIVAEAVGKWRATDAVAAAAAGEFVLRKLRSEAIPRGENKAASPPDVVLMSIDTLRADHLHCYGYERPTSPTLDSLAAGGALFEVAVSPSSWTLPVHMSLLTSLYPSFHKIDRAGQLGSIKLDQAIPTLPELLKKNGYATAGFVAHGYLNPAWGFGRGFDFYKQYDTGADAQLTRAALWVEWHSFHRHLDLVTGPLFVFVHLFDPHGFGRNVIFLDEGVEKTDPRYRIAMYDGQIHFVDTHLKKFLDRLEALGTLSSTLLVITADHGEEFGDHGGSGHKNTLYEEQLRVPLIVSYPAHLKGGRRITEQVSLIDIAPTISALAGLAPVDSFQGVSLVQVLKDEDARSAAAPSRTVFAELHPTDFGAGWDFYARAARGERYKLIRTCFKDGRIRRELYDLSQDPTETKNLHDAPELVTVERRLQEHLDDFLRRAAAYHPEAKEKNRIELDPDVLERLRALGYDD